MRTVRVAVEPPYEVLVGRGALGEVAPRAAAYSRAAILTDERVGELYLAAVAGRGAPSEPALAVPAGEASKRFAVLERVLEFLAASDLDRGSCLVALGGGVVGDLGGLAASLYMRGIAVVQAPTTLLAQVDASVGGKTAVDLAAGKNLAGTFHQPAVVLADTATLATLPEVEYRSGLGEVVKAALIEGEPALESLERARTAIEARDPDALEEVVERCVRLKAAIVARDPRERGERKRLNLGHTFAHAIERAAGYGAVPHGLAVGVGIALALRTSRTAARLAESTLVERTEGLLRRLGLPHDLAALRARTGSALPPAEILAAMRHDKKGAAGRPRLVLPRAAGTIDVDVEVEPALLETVLAGG